MAVILSSCMKVEGLPPGNLNSNKEQDDANLPPIRKVKSTEGTIYWVVDLRRDLKAVSAKSYQLNSATALQTLTNYTYSPGIEQQIEMAGSSLYRTQVKSLDELGRTVLSVNNLVQSPTPAWVGATEIRSYQYDSYGKTTSNRFRRILADGSIQSEKNIAERFDEKRRLIWHRDEGIANGQPSPPNEYTRTYNENDKTVVETYTTRESVILYGYYFFVNGVPAAPSPSWSTNFNRTVESTCEYNEEIESYKCIYIGRIATQTNIALREDVTFKIVQFIYPDRTELLYLPSYQRTGQFLSDGREQGLMRELTYNEKFQRLHYRLSQSFAPAFTYEVADDSTYEYDSLGVNLMRKVTSSPLVPALTTEVFSLQ